MLAMVLSDGVERRAMLGDDLKLRQSEFLDDVADLD